MKQTSSKPELKQATAAVVRDFYGHDPVHTMRAYVALLDGQPVALGGVTYNLGIPCAFADIRDEFRPYKVSIMKFARKIHDIIGDGPCMALASPDIAGSKRLIEWLGFEFVVTTQYGDVYKCPSHKQ